MNGIGGWLRQFSARLSAGLRSFMAGRYGTDRLNMVILCVGLAASLLSVFFRYTPEQILPYLLDVSKTYDLDALKKIAETCDRDQLFALFMKTYCKKDAAADSEYLEDLGRRALDEVCRHDLSFSTSPSVVLYSYMRLVKDEVEDIITITEGVRYQVKAQNLKPLLFTQDARAAIG